MEKVRREKIRDGEGQERRQSEEKVQCAKKVGKSRNTVFFQCFVALEGRKVGSLKRRMRSQLANWEMKNCTPLRGAHFEVKSGKAHHSRTTFGSWDVEKVYAVAARSTFLSEKCVKISHGRTTFGSWYVEKVDAVVARSTFRSQKWQNTWGSDHFWTLRCRNSGRRGGAKHVWKSNVSKTGVFSLFYCVRRRFGGLVSIVS